jgi:hypothetical protein
MVKSKVGVKYDDRGGGKIQKISFCLTQIIAYATKSKFYCDKCLPPLTHMFEK